MSTMDSYKVSPFPREIKTEPLSDVEEQYEDSAPSSNYRLEDDLFFESLGTIPISDVVLTSDIQQEESAADASIETQKIDDSTIEEQECDAVENMDFIPLLIKLEPQDSPDCPSPALSMASTVKITKRRPIGRVVITRKIIRKIFCKICMEPCQSISKLKIHLDRQHNIKIPKGDAPRIIDADDEDDKEEAENVSILLQSIQNMKTSVLASKTIAIPIPPNYQAVIKPTKKSVNNKIAQFELPNGRFYCKECCSSSPDEDLRTYSNCFNLVRHLKSRHKGSEFLNCYPRRIINSEKVDNELNDMEIEEHEAESDDEELQEVQAPRTESDELLDIEQEYSTHPVLKLMSPMADLDDLIFPKFKISKKAKVSKRHHSNKRSYGKGQFQCETCGRSFANFSNVLRHCKQIHRQSRWNAKFIKLESDGFENDNSSETDNDDTKPMPILSEHTEIEIDSESPTNNTAIPAKEMPKLDKSITIKSEKLESSDDTNNGNNLSSSSKTNSTNTFSSSSSYYEQEEEKVFEIFRQANFELNPSRIVCPFCPETVPKKKHNFKQIHGLLRHFLRSSFHKGSQYPVPQIIKNIWLPYPSRNPIS